MPVNSDVTSGHLFHVRPAVPSIVQKFFEALTLKASHVHAPASINLANAQQPSRWHICEGRDDLQGARFPDRHAPGFACRNMGAVLLVNVFPQLEQFGLIAARESGTQLKPSGHRVRVAR